MGVNGKNQNDNIDPIFLKRNVLMLCYYYPPLTDVGCRRSVAFSKYFKKYGWNPKVLSVSNPDSAFCRVGVDETPEGIDVEYCRSLINTYWFLGKINGLLTRLLKPLGIQLRRNHFYDLINIPDPFWGWIPNAVKRGYQSIQRNDIDLIYVSCLPFSAAVAGVLLKKLTGKLLVLDFRDPYALEVPPFPLSYVPRYRRKINRMVETWLLRNADVFIVTPDEIKQRYIQQYPWVREKIFTIYNGIEPDDVQVGEREEFSKFTIVYGGNFYFDYIKSNVFFEALKDLKEAGKISTRTFQFQYYGGDGQRIIEKAQEYNIEDLVVNNGLISYKKMLKILAGADMQLLRIVEANMGTKIFDGLALDVPLLATIPEGEPSVIVRKYSPNSYLVGTQSPNKVVEAILDAMGKSKDHRPIIPKLNGLFLRDFSRESTAKQVMEIITKILCKSSETDGIPDIVNETKGNH